MIQAPLPKFKNLLWMGAILILFFSPVGKSIKSKILQLISTSPSIESVENQQVLPNYRGLFYNDKNEVVPFENFKGKAVILGFWATWCPSCVAEMPSLQKLYNDYKDKISFVLITNELPQKVQDFMSNKGYTIPVFYNDRNLPQLLQTKSIPTTFLISPEGKIIIKKVGVADWNSDQVKNLLDSLIP